MIKLNIRESVYETDELEVLIGKTQVIIPRQERACPSGFLFKLLNGEIVVGGAMSGIDWPVDKYSVPMPSKQTSRKLSWRRSKDNGETWCETPSWPSYNTNQFSNGEIIQMSARWWEIEDGYKGKYSTTLFHSFDNGYTFKKKRVSIVDIPKLAKIEEYWYSNKEHYGAVNHQIVRLQNGSLLASAQGQFEKDIKWRNFVIQSYDRGRTWKYLSTVAFDLTKNGIRPQGFSEPNLLVLPDGDILCFMRSDGAYRNCGALYMSRSRDDGKTWSNADPIADRGVYPTACLMKNGVIVVVYGRPGNWLMFSLDKGETWINHFCFNQPPEPYDCGNYDWIEEIAPDTLFVIYSRTDPNDYMISEIMGTYFTVRPKKFDKI